MKKNLFNQLPAFDEPTEAEINLATKNKKISFSKTSRYRHDTLYQESVKQKNKNQAYALASGTLILRSPGNDLIEYYDEQYKKQTKTGGKNTNLIPPSVVFNLRYRDDIPPPKRNQFQPGPGKYDFIIEKLLPYKPDCDVNYARKTFVDSYKWLVDEPHTEYKFRIMSEVVEFMSNKFDQPSFSFTELRESNTQCWFTKNLAGWSIIWVPDKD